MQCAHCGKTMSNKSNLIRHQRTSKVCLVAQGKIDPRDITPQAGKVSCEACGKEFKKPSWLVSHRGSCFACKKQENLKSAMKSMESRHAAELNRLLKRISALETTLLVTRSNLELQTANVAKQISTTDNSVNLTINGLGELTPEVGYLLADTITQAHFWQGQRGIGKGLRDLRDDKQRPFYHVKDENRWKYEIRVGEQKLRDDRAERIIETVERPVKAKIATISTDLMASSDDADTQKILERAGDCLRFSDPDQNTKFLQGLASKNP